MRREPGSPPIKRSLADTSAAAYVEFLLAFVPLFVLFMGIVQLALLFGARLLVEHAAFRATRAAAVVLDDDPRYYDGEPRLDVEGRGARASDIRHRLSRMGVGLSTGEIGPDEPLDGTLSRRATVELAAALVLLPLSQKAGLSVDSALGSEGLDEATRDTLRRLDVRFLATPDGSDEAPRYGHDAHVTVEVIYRYRCSVPVARQLVCPGGFKEIRSRRTLPIHGVPTDYAAGWPTS